MREEALRDYAMKLLEENRNEVEFSGGTVTFLWRNRDGTFDDEVTIMATDNPECSVVVVDVPE